MEKEINKNIPIMFQRLNKYQLDDHDIRFQEVKIWLMHLEENLNGSYFSREVVEDAIPTLANTPILAFIEENKNGQLDFSDHRVVIEKKDGEFSYKYLGKAIGVIPENNDAQFEDRLCDDGKIRTFLTVRGLLWSKFDDPINVMSRDIIKGQSMELADNYEGEFREDNLFHFTKFSFYGACGLGFDVEPAMKNATIELQFSFEDFKKEVQENVNKFKTYFGHDKKSDENEPASELQEKEDGLMTKQEVAAQFSLTVNQMYDELYRKLKENKFETENWYGEKIETTRYSLIDFDESFVYAKDRKEGYIDVKIPYSKNGDDVVFNFENTKRIKWTPTDWEDGEEELEFENYTLNFLEEAKAEFTKVLTQNDTLIKELDEKANALLKINEKFTALEAQLEDKTKELESLTEFKRQVEDQARKEKIEELFAKYAKRLTKEEIDSFRKREKTIENYDDFEREVKLFVADKIADIVSKDQQSFSRMGIPLENSQPESSSVWDRLSNK